MDHLWNGELFLIGEQPLLDLMLGITITVIMFLAWAAIVALDKVALRKPSGQAT